MKNLKKYGMMAIWFSLIGNSVIFIVKIIIGLETDSIAMIADAWHTLSDSLSSIVVMFGFWLASKPADKEHPFGHGRSESIAAIILASMLGMIGLDNLIESITRLFSAETPEFSTSAIIIFASTILVKEAMAQFSIRVGNKMNSESLKADGWHHRSDAISTLIIVIVAIFGKGIWWADSAMGIIVSVILFYISYKILLSSVNNIMGTQPKFLLQRSIMDIAKEVNPVISSLHHFKLHEYGDHKELTFDIRLPAEMTVRNAHAIADTLEQMILYRLNIRATVHIEPGLFSEEFNTRSHY